MKYQIVHCIPLDFYFLRRIHMNRKETTRFEGNNLIQLLKDYHSWVPSVYCLREEIILETEEYPTLEFIENEYPELLL